MVEVDPRRDRGFEYGCTEAACAGVIDPAALNAFADSRAGEGVIERFLSRDFALDGLEEGADWRNYTVWRIQQVDELFARGRIDEETYGQRRGVLLQALRHIAVAFSFTQLDRSLAG